MALPTVTSHALLADSANRTNPSYTLPSGLAGKIVLVAVGCGTNATISAATLGFTRLETKTSGSVNMLEAWAKVCDGSENGGTLTFTSGSNRAWIDAVLVISGGPSSLSLVAHDSSVTGAGVAPTGVAVTTITANSLVIQLIRSGSTAASPLTPPSGWTKLDEVHNTAGTGPGTLTVATQGQAVVGSSDTGAWASSSSTTYVKITVAISDGSIDPIPVANAGVPQVVASGDTVLLSGSGTDTGGSISAYAWTCIKAQGTGTSTADIVFSSSTVASPSFTAPTSDGALYVLQLIVTDNASQQSAPSTVVILIDDSSGAGVFPRVAGSWNQTGVVQVRRSGSWDVVTL